MTAEMADTHAAAVLVAELSANELAAIRSEVAAGRRETILNALGERGRAQELVRQQYSGRYPFELLQNANDAAAAAGGDGGRVRFVVTDEALLVADEGTGFGPDQVRAICGLGRSSKDPRKSIGYKGLGFKSVGEISERPQVISGSLRFGFDEQRAREAAAAAAGGLDDQRVPTYAFPFPLADADLGGDCDAVDKILSEGFHTILRLPYRSGVTRAAVAEHVRNTIVPRLLLFLDATDALELEGTDRDFTARADRDRGDTEWDVLLEVDERVEPYLVFHHQLPIIDRSLVEGLGAAWAEVESVRVAAAVPLDEQWEPTAGSPQPLHVYFPTEEQTGLPMLLQADFALELDRRHIAATAPESRRYNDWLVDELSTFVAAVVTPRLAVRFPGCPGLISALAPVDAATGVGARVRQRLVEKLADQAFVPTLDGRAVSPQEAWLLPESVPDVAAVHVLLDEPILGAVLPAVEQAPRDRRFLRVDLGVSEVDLQDVLARLDSDRATDVWSYYQLLVTWADRTGRQFAGKLRDVSCVRLQDGTWTTPPDAFFPRQRGEVDFPLELHVPIADLPDDDDVHDLLRQAGVRGFEWRQLVPRVILPALVDPECAAARRQAAFTALREYFRTERGGDAQVDERLGDVLLLARSATDPSPVLQPARQIYFGATWLGHDRLERLYGSFGDPEFLAEPVPNEGRSEARAFFARLGVADRPRLDDVVATGRQYVAQLYAHPHASRYPQVWRVWRGDESVSDAEQCDQGHPQSQQLKRSVMIDRLPELLATADWPRMVVLFQELMQHWVSTYSSAMSVTFACTNVNHNGDRDRTAPSMVDLLLRTQPWLPTVIGKGEKSLAVAADAWRVTLDTPRTIRQIVSALPRELDTTASAALLAQLGVVDAARPAVLDLARLLNRLQEQVEPPLEDDPRRRDAARWAMRTLNDVLATDGDIGGQPIPLLARQGGKPLFTCRPCVANDPLVVQTWEPTHPILDGDRDLARLQRALDLPDLDRLPGQPLPVGPLPEVQDEISQRFEGAKPAIYAVAADHSPALADDVLRRLRRLELIVSERLQLMYRFGDDERRRDDATAYIATRIETDGRRRRYGTGYLTSDTSTRDCDWWRFAPLLASYVGLPTLSDAFTLVLTSGRQAQRQFLLSRGITSGELEVAHTLFDQELVDEDADDALSRLDDLLDLPTVDPVRPDGETVADEPGDGNGSSGGGPSPRESEREERQPPPPLDPNGVSVQRGSAGDQPPDDQQRSRRRPGLGPRSMADLQKQEERRRSIGERGEEAAYLAETRRVTESGHDPKFVRWISRDHPLAPYDLESLDDDGQIMYIEVKATPDSDPNGAFPISEGELLTAIEYGSRYYIYRVLDVDSATPTIISYQDPVRHLREQRARLQLHGARLSFAPATSESIADAESVHLKEEEA